MAHELGIDRVIEHDQNRGYGGKQKRCCAAALDLQADIVVMLHPDHQYTPKLIPAMASLVASGLYPVVLGSRILGGTAMSGGMPLHQYIANRLLTAFQNLCTGAKLSEYHTGYRAFHAKVHRQLSLAQFTDDFIFDDELLSAALAAGLPIGEISCPARYFPDASSINLRRSIIYGLGVLGMISAAFWRRCRARF